MRPKPDDYDRFFERELAKWVKKAGPGATPVAGAPQHVENRVLLDRLCKPPFDKNPGAKINPKGTADPNYHSISRVLSAKEMNGGPPVREKVDGKWIQPPPQEEAQEEDEDDAGTSGFAPWAAKEDVSLARPLPPGGAGGAGTSASVRNARRGAGAGGAGTSAGALADVVQEQRARLEAEAAKSADLEKQLEQAAARFHQLTIDEKAAAAQAKEQHDQRASALEQELRDAQEAAAACSQTQAGELRELERRLLDQRAAALHQELRGRGRRPTSSSGATRRSSRRPS